MKYVNVIIDNNSDNTDNFYTYGCGDDSVAVGCKVLVPFNRGNKPKDAYVFQVFSELQEKIKGLKQVTEVDNEVRLTEEIMDTCAWMKKRYACKYIDGLKCFTPAGTVSKRGKKRVPYKSSDGEERTISNLTEEQDRALGKIFPSMDQGQHKIFLLQGVTGSGKTEVYIRIIERCLEKGKTAIMLVPEISLTRQVIGRFIGRFGADSIAVLHSKLSLGERYDEWIRIRRGQVKIVIGARSAVFAPLENIGAVILDEEHEVSYKSDKTPKYDTVEVALKRVMWHTGILVLGSATPSVVSSYRVKEGIYEKICLKERYNKVPLPLVDIVDMRKELREGNKSIFSRALYGKMAKCLEDGRQIILFLNRRGYASFISCRECGYVMKCPECGISLTYHKAADEALCHYCGYKEPLPKLCPDCGSKYIRQFGTGTEKVEEATTQLFPDAGVLRLDLDTIKKKGSLDAILKNFGERKAAILIGTQLVAKGLDFRNVGLVGVVLADATLNIPDFRSPERTFQLVTQAAGRAGRGDEQGSVIVQTYSPEHYAITGAAAQDYDGFYKAEILMRSHMGYPPYCDLIQLLFSAEDEALAMDVSEKAERYLRSSLGEKNSAGIFPPQPAPLYKVSGIYRYHILIKCPKGKRNTYMAEVDTLRRGIAMDKKNACTMVVDVNPYSLI